MKKLLVLAVMLGFSSVSAQYCAFYDFEAKNPEMVISTLEGMMKTGWGEGIQGTKSLFMYQFNGTNRATHSVQFCFPDEKAFSHFMSSFAQSVDAQLFGEKLGNFVSDVSQTLNTPVWYNGKDWANDNAFMLYQMNVTDPSKYLKEFKTYSQFIAKKLGFDQNSFGLAYPIIGKTEEYTHFVWIGAPDAEAALSRTKQMMSDPSFAEFAKKVSGARTMVNTVLSIRLMDF